MIISSIIERFNKVIELDLQMVLRYEKQNQNAMDTRKSEYPEPYVLIEHFND